jgi:hypothetical protein
MAILPIRHQVWETTKGHPSELRRHAEATERHGAGYLVVVIVAPLA